MTGAKIEPHHTISRIYPKIEETRESHEGTKGGRGADRSSRATLEGSTYNLQQSDTKSFQRQVVYPLNIVQIYAAKHGLD